MNANADAAMDLDAVDIMDWDSGDLMVTDLRGVRHQSPHVAVESNSNVSHLEGSPVITPTSSLTLQTLPQSRRFF